MHYSVTGLGSKMPVFLCVLCELQAEMLQEHAEGCVQVDLQKKNPSRLKCFVGVVFWS